MKKIRWQERTGAWVYLIPDDKIKEVLIALKKTSLCDRHSLIETILIALEVPIRKQKLEA